MALCRRGKPLRCFIGCLLLFFITIDRSSSFSITMMANTNTRSKPSRGTNRNRAKQGRKSKPRTNQNPERKKVSKPKKIYTLEELLNMSIAQAIVESTSSSHLLQTSSRLWLPIDDDLPPHLKTQAIHHEKRIKAASQLLNRLGDFIGRERGVSFNAQLWDEAEENGFKRAILGASLPFDGNISPEYKEKEVRNICIALKGLHAIVGFTLPNSCSHDINFDLNILNELKSLIQRADLAVSKLQMHEAVEARWAIRGIISRIGFPLINLILTGDKKPDDFDNGEYLPVVMKEAIPNLEARVANLPFDVIPSCVDWDTLVEGGTMKTLLSQIPFKFDTITTRSGSKVEERRGTAWVANEGIGSLAYSGKLMNPHALPPVVSAAMRKVEQSILEHRSHQQLEICSDEFGYYFDCALCNHYPNEESACKFHTDPEHGTYWERLTCVVSAGNDDVRRFAFRPIPDLNYWAKYDTQNFQNNGEQQNDDAITPAVIPLFPGDLVMMDFECNDVFHHAVYSSQDDRIRTEHSSDGRVSLVFKKAMDRGNGRKGHGKAGKGRRSRR